ncbi:Serine carboxypeptidase S28 family protein, putative [Theobroma cacao]|uniref:Serine carboxypeptidase S28 family protein, putative n=1 Tax=Theobroma cacao TaxID=3641 RepID=A0A061GZU4_THECC|nr:Serine carboxypeptidase S28 family protein, putative [Theobroma cacao]
MMEAQRLLLQSSQVLLLLPTVCLAAAYPDHFNYKYASYLTCQQKYIVNSNSRGGANTSSPIFVYTGDKAWIDGVAISAGFIIDLASRFRGLLLYIEHRYYGDSMAFGYKQIAGQNASTLGFFSASQALADYAELIIELKRNLSEENCPVIAIGGSYGGMLASWFRLKYPHLPLVPWHHLLQFSTLTKFLLKMAIMWLLQGILDENCYNTIRLSWFEIDKVAVQPNGLMNLRNIFNSCMPLYSSEELKSYLGFVYVFSARSDNPPYNSVSDACNAIDGAPAGTDILGKVVRGFNASFFGSGGSCNNVIEIKPNNGSGWFWQTCTEIVMPIGHGENVTMFQASPFDLENYTRTCLEIFGVSPRPHWIITEFGGHDIKYVLGNFASNIIFSNGLRNPWSAGGVLQNISDSVVAVYTKEGAHCLDLSNPSSSDPDWLVAQRDKEINIIGSWSEDYKVKLGSKAGKKIHF